MVDLSSKYMGLQLKNPLVASASPLSKKVGTIRKLEDQGISAVVMYSLFEEQINHASRELDYFLNLGTESFAEALTYFPEMQTYNVGPENYLDLIRKAKEAVQIPIIASLNGISSGGWVKYAKSIEEAGADALELNIYFVPTATETDSQQLEDAYVNLVYDVSEQIRIPLAVKISPYYTALPHFLSRLVKAGAKGLVLFNRFYQPDLDIENFEVQPSLHLSTSEDLRLPLRWIAILYGRLNASLALTSGVHTAQDAAKAIMAGADVAMMASELVEKGPGRVSEILVELQAWMEGKEYASVSQMRGSMSQKSVAQPAVFERANYMKALSTFDNRLKD
ncbi:dihydroorotate dehydrogenase [Ornatilinea apprima]|uniref:Dihydroorotate dehydrogenase n=1 Tax=Ornatilinea apprima TaxID=1134406 RepID=A0A0P6WQ13_9CHLR|nr:dihydroorotate dehydrogenase-like protein [Ornatilinea apprima]KPL70889.1 dihydroorotate dehydrogenase [Ornatilinea apprima]